MSSTRTRGREADWKRWGPYLSERQWGTVREDYSVDGNAWDSFSHDQARSRAYRWGEDGLAGFSDAQSRLCLALALWNEQDPILKERLFGLTNSQGNHGEDVKEYYFFLDATPTHTWNRMLYKYPQGAFPYIDLVETNARRTRNDFEYELLDTGIFADDRYFDVFVDYAKESPDDILMRVTVHNRGPEAAVLHALPTVWFRNTWSWHPGRPKPEIATLAPSAQYVALEAMHRELGAHYVYAEPGAELLVTENETNTERLWGQPNTGAYVKDGINDAIVHGLIERVNPDGTGTKASAHYRLDIPAGGSASVRLRLCRTAPDALTDAYPAGDPFGPHFEETCAFRKTEADTFYATLTPGTLNADQANVMRQALAGMLWTKQHYYFDLDAWLTEHGTHPLGGTRRPGARNAEWFHMLNDDVISMPDTWEYPWFAAWDLAFHTLPLSIVDIDFAKSQLALMLREFYLHPNGQVPAYEWNFGDVNPPVHAWACLYLYQTEREERGVGDIEFLKHAFHKLLLNFTWWVNRKDPDGRNVFQGGFLGLDNIGVFDRSAPLPTGGSLEQADGTAWMAFYCQTMLAITLELALIDPAYADMAQKFVEHFLWIAAAMDRVGDFEDEMWDEEDGFFYDVLRSPQETGRLKVRSLVGLLPLCAVTVFPREVGERFPDVLARIRRFLVVHPELGRLVAETGETGVDGRRMLALLDETKLRRVLEHLLDEAQFFSPHGIRSLSRYHAAHPFTLSVHGEEYRVGYLPAESDSGMFGGNSNWRGPIWFPMNTLILRALLQLYTYYGDDFRVECPTGSGNLMTLFEVARELTQRLTNIFLRDADGRRPVYGGAEKFQTDPHWRDYILFYEYFHGDNGAGLGASHQTGWTGMVARFLQMLGYVQPQTLLAGGMRTALAFQTERLFVPKPPE